MGQKRVESAEGVIDALGVLEAAGLLNERRTYVGLGLFYRSMAGAQPGRFIGREGGALASGRSAMLTASCGKE